MLVLFGLARRLAVHQALLAFSIAILWFWALSWLCALWPSWRAAFLPVKPLAFQALPTALLNALFLATLWLASRAAAQWVLGRQPPSPCPGCWLAGITALLAALLYAQWSLAPSFLAASAASAILAVRLAAAALFLLASLLVGFLAGPCLIDKRPGPARYDAWGLAAWLCLNLGGAAYGAKLAGWPAGLPSLVGIVLLVSLIAKRRARG